MKKVVAIIGPTAVGKTKLSIDIALKYHNEIISGDSVQVYKGLDIGSAKITKADGSVVYEAEIKGKDLLFDAKGNLIKK